MYSTSSPCMTTYACFGLRVYNILPISSKIVCKPVRRKHRPYCIPVQPPESSQTRPSSPAISAQQQYTESFQDANTQMLGVLLVVALLATVLILSLGFQKEQNQQENMVGVNPGTEIKIDIRTTVFSSAISHHNPQVQILEKSSCLNGLPRDLKDKVASNSNALVIDQTNVDTSDRASLLHSLHQTPFETTSFHIGRDMLLEGQQTSLGVANDDSARLPSLPAQDAQRQSPPDAVTHSRVQIPCLKNELKVGVWVIMISAGGVVSVLSGLVGNETARLTHKILFQAFTALNYVSLVLGVGVFLLTLTRPKILGLVTIVKVTMWTALGSVTYALAFATCPFLSEPVEVILVLVAPLVMVCLVVIPSFCCRKSDVVGSRN